MSECFIFMQHIWFLYFGFYQKIQWFYTLPISDQGNSLLLTPKKFRMYGRKFSMWNVNQFPWIVNMEADVWIKEIAKIHVSKVSMWLCWVTLWALFLRDSAVEWTSTHGAVWLWTHFWNRFNDTIIQARQWVIWLAGVFFGLYLSRLNYDREKPAVIPIAHSKMLGPCHSESSHISVRLLCKLHENPITSTWSLIWRIQVARVRKFPGQFLIERNCTWPMLQVIT